MSDFLKHECGIGLIRLRKPLSYYKEKYGTAFYGVNKLYLLMEKQHNRGQDGAGVASIKLDVEPGQRYISRIRSVKSQPIQDVFNQINQRINTKLEANPDFVNDVDWQKKNIPFAGELLLGHVRYGTFGGNNQESVHPFLRQNNWMHRNLILAGNFNMTNVNELFQNLVNIGQHPKENTDAVTVMEKIGHFLDDSVAKLYKTLKKEGYSKIECSPLIAERLNVGKILRKSSKNWDGGYAMAGLLGHGDSFVLRDPAGIRPAFYYTDDEVTVVASERPVIQTVFNVPFESIKEIPPGNALITKKNGDFNLEKILEPLEKRSCSFERIYFSRGSDADIYKERKKMGRLLLPDILKAIDGDTRNTVFSYIPNTAETSFYGLIDEVESHLNENKTLAILQGKRSISAEGVKDILSERPRIEKVAIKDVKLRTFITEDSSRNDLVEHVYDVSYGIVNDTDNLVIVDDSIVRGTTLKNSIIKMLDRLQPKKIIIVSAAPQIRYPDCYGIDIANLESLIAFRATLELLKDINAYHLVDEIYQKCKQQINTPDSEIINYVKEIYAPFTNEQISDKVAELVSNDSINADVKIIFQTVANLHKSCPEHKGDWYFTGNYPTPGGKRVVNRAFINFYEGIKERAYS